jgi:putative sigma-54 modulation protein
MSIEVTIRHVDAGDWHREYASSMGEKLMGDFPRVEHVHVILDGQRHLKSAEFVVQGKNHIRLEAKEEAETMRAAIDQCADKIEKQLRKSRDKVQQHKSPIGLSELDRAASEASAKDE